MKTTKEIIRDAFSDAIGNFLYYDRKEDEELPRGVIEQEIIRDPTLIDELLEMLRAELVRIGS